MRPNKVYPVIVSCRDDGDFPAITLRLVMPGAQIVPVEQPLNQQVTFHLTPLARGKLRGAHLEVLNDGMKVRQIYLPCTVCTQRPTVIWLCLAFLVPWLILHFFVYAPIGYQGPDLESYVNKLDSDERLHAEGKRAPPKSVPPTKVITTFVRDNTPELDGLLGKDSAVVDYYKNTIQYFPEKAYVQLFLGHYSLSNGRQPVSFYVFAFLLAVAVISFLLRRERRKRVYS
jgi:hypothetical protein